MNIYFDHNATTYKSEAVINAMSSCEPLNPSSIHSSGRKAKMLIEESRNAIIQTLNIPANFRIIFTSSATEANNMLLNSFKNVLITATAHPSITKATPQSEIIAVNKSGEIKLDNNQLSNAESLISIILANNETGVIQPLDDIIDVIKKYGKLLHLDVVQAIGKMQFNAIEIGADAYTISAHKFGGPNGVGCLIYNPAVIKLKPLMLGGGQEYGLRPGTENVMAIHGLGIAMTEIESRVQKMQNNIISIRDYIESEILQICDNNAIIFGKTATNRLPNTTAITMPNVKSEVQLVFFDSNNIAVSAGAACSAGRVERPTIQMAMGYSYREASCTLRVSLGTNNTLDEAKFFVQKWKELYEKSQSNNI